MASCCLEISVRFPFAVAKTNVLVSGVPSEERPVLAHPAQWPLCDSLTRAYKDLFSLIKFYIRSIRHVQVCRDIKCVHNLHVQCEFHFIGQSTAAVRL